MKLSPLLNLIWRTTRDELIIVGVYLAWQTDAEAFFVRSDVSGDWASSSGTVPKVIHYLYDTEVTGFLRKIEEREALMRVFTNPNTPSPEIHLLSNGRYDVMVTNSGGGYSRWNNMDLLVARRCRYGQWRFFHILKDLKSNKFWSVSYQPSLKNPAKLRSDISQSRAEFKRRDYNIDTHTEIAVSPEDDIEIRRVKITNKSRSERIIEITSYAR